MPHAWQQWLLHGKGGDVSAYLRIYSSRRQRAPLTPDPSPTRGEVRRNRARGFGAALARGERDRAQRRPVRRFAARHPGREPAMLIERTAGRRAVPVECAQRCRDKTLLWTFLRCRQQGFWASRSRAASVPEPAGRFTVLAVQLGVCAHDRVRAPNERVEAVSEAAARWHAAFSRGGRRFGASRRRAAVQFNLRGSGATEASNCPRQGSERGGQQQECHACQ